MADILNDLRQERAKYGATMTDDECVELCNTVAWNNRHEGWGLSGKTSGTRGRRYDGVEVAHDILHHGPSNDLYDVLRAAGAASTPVFNNVGKPRPGRPFVDPIVPKNGAGEQPAPPPVNPPTDGDLNAVLAAIADVRANDDEDHQTLANLLGILKDKLDAIEAQAALLENLRERMEVAIALAETAAHQSYHGSARFLGGSVTLTPEGLTRE